MTQVLARCPEHGQVLQHHSQVVLEPREGEANVWCPHGHGFICTVSISMMAMLWKGGCKTVEETVMDFVKELDKL
jgi:hypothetical protein